MEVAGPSLTSLVLRFDFLQDFCVSFTFLLLESRISALEEIVLGFHHSWLLCLSFPCVSC